MKKRKKRKIKLNNELKQFVYSIPIVFIFVLIDVFKPSMLLIIRITTSIFAIGLLSYITYLLHKDCKKRKKRKNISKRKKEENKI